MHSAAVARCRKEENERRKYEEDNFTRLQQTKEQKRQERKRARRANGGAVIADDALDDEDEASAAGAHAPHIGPLGAQLAALERKRVACSVAGKRCCAKGCDELRHNKRSRW